MSKSFVTLMLASGVLLVGNSYGEWVGGTRGWNYSNADTNFYPWSTACRVGIGTMSPEVKLDVVGGGVDIDRTGNNPFLNFEEAGTIRAAVFYDITNNNLVLRNQEVSLKDVVINTNGNVGIGTTSPGAKLEVMGNTYISGNLGIGMTGPFTRLHVMDYSPRIRLQRNTDAGGYISGLEYSNNAGNAGSYMYMSPNSITLGGGFHEIGSSPYVTIANGNVSISGKLTASGGIDPPYISFSDESHESIREFAKDVEGHEKVMQFWNGEAHRMEVYVIDEDHFYTITGELVEE